MHFYLSSLSHLDPVGPHSSTAHLMGQESHESRIPSRSKAPKLCAKRAMFSFAIQNSRAEKCNDVQV
jgi:hypothetical protein